MVRALLVVFRALRRAWLVELVGAGCIVAGVYLWAGLAAALVAVGIAFVLKAFDIDAGQ